MATKTASKPAPTAQVPALRKSTAVGLPAEWAAELAAEAKDVSSVETPSISNVSFRAGMLSIGGTPMPNNELECIIIGTAFERALYEGPFDPNRIRNPICFAITEDGKESKPHENSLYPQHEQCSGCPMNEWFSAGEGRRGKACKENRRLALIPTDKLENPADIKAAELAMAKIPVTSVANWSNYVHTVSAQFAMPYWAVITKIAVQPHIKNQFEVLFSVVEPIDDVAALEALKFKRSLTKPFVMSPYSKATEEGDTNPHTTQIPQTSQQQKGKPAAPVQTVRPPVKRKF